MALQIAAKDVCGLDVLDIGVQDQTGEGGIPVRMHIPTLESLLSSPEFIC